MTSLPLLCLALVAFATLASGCLQADEPVTYDDPTRQDRLTVQGGLAVQVLSPTPDATLEGPEQSLVIRAWVEDDPDAAVRVLAGPVGGDLIEGLVSGGAGPERRFAVPMSLVHGTNAMRIVVEEVDGVRRRTLNYDVTYRDRAPGLRVERVRAAAAAGGCDPAEPYRPQIATATACVSGRASSADGALPRSVVSGAAQATITPDGGFVIEVPVQRDAVSVVHLRVIDAQGRDGSVPVRVVQDSTPPVLGLTRPAAPSLRTSDAMLRVTGTASDDRQLHRLRIESRGVLLASLPVRSSWDVELPLAVGPNPITVVAEDAAGNRATLDVDAVRERITTLFAPDPDGADARLELTRQALGELLSEQAQRDLVLARVSMRAFLLQAVESLRNPFANGVDTSSWGDPEWNFFRLLNLSADTADFTGTSLEPMSDLAYGIGLPTARVLAQVLAVPVDEPALTNELVTEVFIRNLIATHPAVEFDAQGEPLLVITLFDALNDLAPLSERYGPVPAIGHPGIIGGGILAPVLEPGFMMVARARSNLTQYQGIDIDRLSKDFLFVLDGDQVIELDVFDDESFSVVGIVDEPTADLTIAVDESPLYLTAGTQQFARPDPDNPGFYLGNSPVWDLRPWELERIVAEGIYLRFSRQYADQGFEAELVFSTGSLERAAVFDWNRGWLVTTTAGGLGSPPVPQYIWDALLEIAQVRLHDGGLAEGEANARFTLNDVPVGVDAEGLIAALRPELDAQQEQLIELLLGTGGLASTGLDFYFVAGDGGQPMLFFRHPDDSDDPWAYDRPGFFADPDLTEQLATTQPLPGTTDDVRLKAALTPGLVLYAQDESGQVVQITIIEATGGFVRLIATPVEEL